MHASTRKHEQNTSIESPVRLELKTGFFTLNQYGSCEITQTSRDLWSKKSWLNRNPGKMGVHTTGFVIAEVQKCRCLEWSNKNLNGHWSKIHHRTSASFCRPQPSHVQRFGQLGLNNSMKSLASWQQLPHVEGRPFPCRTTRDGICCASQRADNAKPQTDLYSTPDNPGTTRSEV